MNKLNRRIAQMQEESTTSLGIQPGGRCKPIQLAVQLLGAREWNRSWSFTFLSVLELAKLWRASMRSQVCTVVRRYASALGVPMKMLDPPYLIPLGSLQSSPPPSRCKPYLR